MNPELKQAMAEVRLSFDGFDAWGSTMAWWFAIADALTDADPALVPASWDFRQSPLGSDTDAYEYEIVSQWSTDTLLHVGNVLTRYAARLKAAGQDY